MPTARVDAVDELLVLIPYLLGYRPADALVILGLRRGRLGIVQRVDWPPPERAFPAGEAGRLASAVVADGGDAALLVLYDDGAERRRAAVGAVARELARCRVRVLDRVVVTAAGRWRSLDCPDPACCPADGRPLPAAADVPAVAHWVLQGVCPLPDRAALAACIEPAANTPPFDLTTRQRPTAIGSGPDERGRAGGGAASGAPDRSGPQPRPANRDRAAREAWGAVLGLRGRPVPVAALDPAVVRCAVAAAAVPALRDEVIELACPGILDPPDRGAGTPDGAAATPGGGPARVPYDALGDGAAVHDILYRFTEFARRLPEPVRADTLAMTAATAWWYGHGTLARICARRALQIDPTQRLAALVGELLDHGLRPQPECA